MNTDRWHQIEETFHGALQYAPADREAFLAQVCGEDHDLLTQVKGLLSSHDSPNALLFQPQMSTGFRVLANLQSQLKPGQIFGPYVVKGEIGRGGMGTVYLASDQRLGRVVALKLLPQSFNDDATWVARFKHEAQVASSIGHPNVAHIYEVNELESYHYIAMEYIDGITLRSRLRDGESLSLDEAIDFMLQIARALKAAHSVGVLHRDIKPDNVMVHQDGYAKVLDFGLAKTIVPLKSSSSGNGLANSVETEAGLIVGSPAYMSPEQARGQKVDQRTDLWSLGVVFYELLNKRNPFLSDTASDTIAAILTLEPPPLSVPASHSREQIQLIINRLLAKKSEERYSAAQEVIDDLQELREHLRRDSHGPENAAVTSAAGHADDRHTRDTGFFAVISSASNRAIAAAKPTKLRISVLALLIMLTVILVRYTSFSTPAIHGAPITSVAVLPFVIGDGDASPNYMSDGLSEALIERLSRLARLKVMARSSTLKYRDKSADLKSVAKDLNVQAIVKGSISVQGDNLFVRVELLDAAQLSRIWGEEYRYKTSELPLLVNSASRQIASSLNLGLSETDLNLMTRDYTPEGNAYEWYLKGRFYWNQLTEEALDKSVECFNQALTIDPNYPLAYAGLANSYITLGAAYRPTSDVRTKAEQNAVRAVELGGNLAEAHYAMAVTYYVNHWNLPQAEKELNYALELNPNYAMASSLLSSINLSRGDLVQATTYIDRALELDPFSLLFISRLSYIYYCQRESEKQLKLIQSYLQRDPNASLFYNDMAIAYAQLGKYDEAIAASQRAMVLMGQDADTLSTLAIVHAISGRKAEATWVANSLKQLSAKKYVSPFLMASVYNAIDDKDEAFSWLEKAVQQRDTYVLRIKVDAVFDGLRSDPRYARLLQSLNLS